MNNAAIETEGKWAVVKFGVDERAVELWQVVNLETGSRSRPLGEESARRVWRDLLSR